MLWIAVIELVKLFPSFLNDIIYNYLFVLATRDYNLRGVPETHAVGNSS